MYLAISVDLTYARMLKAQDGIEMRRHDSKSKNRCKWQIWYERGEDHDAYRSECEQSARTALEKWTTGADDEDDRQNQCRISAVP